MQATVFGSVVGRIAQSAEASYIQQLTRRFPDALQTKAILGER